METVSCHDLKQNQKNISNILQDYNIGNNITYCNCFLYLYIFFQNQNCSRKNTHFISTPLHEKKNQLPCPFKFFFVSNFDLIRTFAENMQIYVYHETADYLILNN